MRNRRIAMLLATIAFGIVVAFQFAAAVTTTQGATPAGSGISQPYSGLPYD